MAKGKTTATSKRRRRAPRKTKPAGLPVCQVDGCEQPGLETHVLPDGAKVTLCGRCGEMARTSLRQAELRASALDVAAAPYERVMARRYAREVEKVHRRTGGLLLG